MGKLRRSGQAQGLFHRKLVFVAPLAHKVLPGKRPRETNSKRLTLPAAAATAAGYPNWRATALVGCSWIACRRELPRRQAAGSKTRNGTQQRRFSAAVRPRQHRHFLLWDRKGDIINDDFF